MTSIKPRPVNICTRNRLLQVELCEVETFRWLATVKQPLNWGHRKFSPPAALSLSSIQTFTALRNALFLFPMFTKEHKYVNDSLENYSNTCKNMQTIYTKMVLQHSVKEVCITIMFAFWISRSPDLSLQELPASHGSEKHRGSCWPLGRTSFTSDWKAGRVSRTSSWFIKLVSV